MVIRLCIPVLCCYLCLIIFSLLHTPLPINGQVVKKPSIIKASDDMYELVSNSVSLECEASGGPTTKIDWFHAETGKPVEDYQTKPATSNKMIMKRRGGQSSILILGLQRRDEGKYYCNASNAAGWSVSRNITVQIAFLRKNFVHPQSKRAKVGETVQMECKPPRGLPKPKVVWKKNGKLLDLNELNAPKSTPHFMILPNGNLRIYDAKISDSGRYQCVARNKAGKRESNVAVLHVREKPAFIRPPGDQKVSVNSDVIFRCLVKGDPPPSIIWKRADGEMPPRNEILSDNSLKLYHVQSSAAGRYICQASNKVGRIEAVARLIVQSPPSFVRTPVDIEVPLGGRAVFHCKVSGRPMPTIYWDAAQSHDALMFTERRVSQKDTSRIRVFRDGRLVINSVRKSDEGRYVCHATSYSKHIRSSASLTVLDGNTPYPPVIEYGPTSLVLPTGRTAMLRCIVDAMKSRRTKVTWLKNGAALSLDFSDPRYDRASDGSLQINDVVKEDSGNFTCVANSDGLTTNLTARLEVRQMSYGNGNVRQLPSITALPKKPINVEVHDIQDTWVHLNWEPNPTVGVSQSQSYQVEAFTSSNRRGWVIKSEKVHQNTYRVKNLKPDTEYWFIVRSRNIHGLGAPSDMTNPVVTKPKSPMKHNLFRISKLIKAVKITNVRLSSISVSAIRIRWEVRGGNDALSTVRGFQIHYRSVPISQCLLGNEYKHCSLSGNRQQQIHQTVKSGHSSPASLSRKALETKSPVKTKRLEEQVSVDSRTVNDIIYGLKPFHCYEVEIEPYSVGEFIGRITGEDSIKKTALTFDTVPSKAPDRISAQWFVNNSVQISWHPPPLEGRNGLLIGYSIHVVGNESRFNRHITTNESVHSYVVNNMVPDVAYTIHLAARTCKGEGIRSVAVRLGPATQRASAHSVITQPWFIGTMIGVGLVWILLCLFTVYICRHRYHRNLLYKPVYFNGSLEERTQMGGGYNMRSLVGKHDPDIMPTAPPPPPPPLSFVGTNEKSMSTSTDGALKNGAYATPSSILPPVAPVQNPVAPYATTSIIQNINLQPPNSGPYYGPSSENSISETKGDGAMGGGPGCGNSSSYGGHYSEGGPPGCNTCSEYSESQGEEMVAWPASIIGGRQKIKNIGEIIPPPPEYPPPPAPASGSVPMSPKPSLSVTMGTSMMNGPPVPMSVRLPPTSQEHHRKSAPDDCEDATGNRQENKDTLLERGCSQSIFSPPPPPKQSVPPPSSPLATEEGVYTGIDSESEGQSDHSDHSEGAAPLGHRSPGMQSSLVGEAAESCAGSSVLASWASGLTGEGPGEAAGGGQEEISSVDSSCSDSAPFLPEADFANAVQKAAGNSVPSRRRRHMPRTPSPGYSTDSNYAALPPQPHRPYPKSERKRQMKQYTGNSKTSPHPRYVFGPSQGHVYHMHGSLGSEDGRINNQNPLTTFADSPIV